MTIRKLLACMATPVLTLAVAAPAQADIKVGIIASLTGPAAALGADTRRAVALLPESVGGEKINFILLDDATDPTNGVKNVRKLISEDKVDALLGPNLISTAVAIADVANTEKTPMVSVAPLDISGERRRYIFRSEPSAEIMVQRIVRDMQERGIKTLGFIGFADSWGDLLWDAISKQTAGKIKIVASERFGRADSSVQAQALKLIAAKPDAIFVGASGTPAAMPQITLRQRGYKGEIYQSHGVTSRDFLRVGGKAVEGALIPVGPVLVAEQLPDTHPNKAVAEDFVRKLEEKHGSNTRSTFAGASWDAWLLLKGAIVAAQKKGDAKPGTQRFRDELRENLEKTSGLVGSNGVYTLNANDHAGYDANAVVLITVENGNWKLVK